MYGFRDWFQALEIVGKGKDYIFDEGEPIAVGLRQ